MKKILIINGPNLNLLGNREDDIYGKDSLDKIKSDCEKKGIEKKLEILDSLRAIKKPKIEIHLSNIYSREEYRKKSITSEGVHGLICGFGGNSYLLGIEAICKLIYK